MNIFLYILIIFFISVIPIVFWAYAFSYIDNEGLNRKRFFSGIIGGAISVVPILYMDKIIQFFKIGYLNIFSYVKGVNNIYSIFSFSFSLSLFLMFLAVFSFVGTLLLGFHLLFKTYIKNIFVFIIFVIFIGIFIYILNYFSFRFDFLNSKLNSNLEFNTIVFNSFKLVIFYYLLVAFIEEASKHFNFLSSSLFNINSISDGVLNAIFIALGFSLVENILYFYNYYINNGFDISFLKVYFFRSIFSIITHIFASSLMAYFFTKAYLLYKNEIFTINYIKIFFIGLFLSVLVHFIFDFSLTLGFNFIIILYLIVGYFYVSSIFYKK